MRPIRRLRLKRILALAAHSGVVGDPVDMQEIEIGLTDLPIGCVICASFDGGNAGSGWTVAKNQSAQDQRSPDAR